MTLIEIAMFKNFVKDRGMDELFINLYVKYRLKQNPLSIEAYLVQADAANVMLSAFYWLTNSHFGYDFWQDFQKRWDRYRVEKLGEYPMCDIRNFKGKGKVLRHNWDSPHFWKTEARVDSAERYGVILDANEIKRIENEYKRQNIDKKVVNNEKPDVLKDFELVDIRRKKTNRLGDDEISLNTKTKFNISFNQTTTKELQKRGGYEYAALRVNKKGEVCLFLNDETGVPMLDGKRKDGGNENATINSKALCVRIKELLGVEEGYVTLKIKEISKTDDYVAYLLTQK